MDEHRMQEEAKQEDRETCTCHHHDHDHDEHGHGHHHHHDHDEHGHGHHHHHDHDEHGHGHHHHDHDDHDHEHHHDHGHQYEVPGFRIFETHDHEGATICSFEKDIRKDSQSAVAEMEQCIRTLEQWLDETEAVIGHVKGYVKEAGPITTFSTVGCGLNIEQHEGGTLSIGFASIVFGPSEEELKNKVAEVFAAL